MALQNFVDQVGPTVSASWLNQIDNFVNTLFAGAATGPQALAAIGAPGLASNQNWSGANTISGSLSVPTQTAGNNTTLAASTAFVMTAVSGAVAGVSSFNTRSGAVTLTAADTAASITAGANAGGMLITTTAPTATSDSFAIVRTTGYTGGTAGHVNSAIYLDTTVSAGVTAYEWGITSVIHNNSATGQHVGGYFQGNKLLNGFTWGAVAESCDTTNVNTSSTYGSLVGLEVDSWCNGTDFSARRIGVSVVAGNAYVMRGLGTGISRGEAWAGVQIGSYNGDISQGGYYYGLSVTQCITSCILLASTTPRGLQSTGTFQVGIDMSTGTHTTSAIRIKAGDNFSWNATSSIYTSYNATSGFVEFTGAGIGAYSGVQYSASNSQLLKWVNGAVPGLNYTVGGTLMSMLTDNGGILLTSPIVYGAGLTVSSATGGAASALPSLPVGYLQFNISGTTYHVPFYG